MFWEQSGGPDQIKGDEGGVGALRVSVGSWELLTWRGGAVVLTG